jgi:RNase adaptor protein for sRNA GlmZ degradation
VLGAYGFRGYFEQKKHFIDSIPPAIQNLRELLSSSTVFHYPYLMDVLKRLTELPQFAQIEATASRADGYKTTDLNPYNAHPADGPATFSKYDAQGPLVVKVFSFSYGKGIPEDESGNGGGYVFDCRALNNPGKYDKYKAFTGLDDNVIKFLQKESTIDQWLVHVYAMVDESVERYMKRNFTDLMVCFGCTGGQHRSVYAAQHLAEHIYKKFNVRVELSHREQSGHDRTFNPVEE